MIKISLDESLERAKQLRERQTSTENYEDFERYHSNLRRKYINNHVLY